MSRCACGWLFYSDGDGGSDEHLLTHIQIAHEDNMNYYNGPSARVQELGYNSTTKTWYTIGGWELSDHFVSTQAIQDPTLNAFTARE